MAEREHRLLERTSAYSTTAGLKKWDPRKYKGLCTSSPTSSEVCGVTDAIAGPPGPESITEPPCIKQRKKRSSMPNPVCNTKNVTFY